jgi:hypothetical protein
MSGLAEGGVGLRRGQDFQADKVLRKVKSGGSGSVGPDGGACLLYGLARAEGRD